MCLLFVWDVVPCKEEVCYVFSYNATNYDFVFFLFGCGHKLLKTQLYECIINN